MANLLWSDVTYCKYGYSYKKAVAQFALGAQARPLLREFALRAVQSSRGRHPSAAQRGFDARARSCKRQLYSIFEALCREIASIVNARRLIPPRLRLLGFLQSFHPRLQLLADAPQHGYQLAVVQGRSFLRAAGPGAKSSLVDVGPIEAFGRGPIEDCLQLVQIR